MSLASTQSVLIRKVLALVDQSIGTNRNTHSYVTAARPIADNLVIYDPDLICVHDKMQYMYSFVWSVTMAHILLIDGLELACDYVDLESAYDSCWADITVDKFVDLSACRVAASYKPPMLVTRVRLPACACLKLSSWWLTGWRSCVATRLFSIKTLVGRWCVDGNIANCDSRSV